MKKSFHCPGRANRLALAWIIAFCSISALARAQSYVYIDDVPDYTWYAGCFGTASGNLMGFWDRNGFPDFYTGPTGGGLAPLDTFSTANKGIRSMWASKAGVDGRPADQYGHIDDYVGLNVSDNMDSYESTADDPYVLRGRPEHKPDCIGDFIGLNQKKWTSLAGECDGNIDAYSFVFWDKTGARRVNHAQTNSSTGQYTPDIQSGLRAWTRYRGYDADVFTQLTSFNPERTVAAGFTYNDVKAEIDAGYPVLCFLQPATQFYRNLSDPVPMKANPEIHGVLIYGYYDDPAGGYPQTVLIRTSWGSGSGYGPQSWSSFAWLGLFPVRGVIGYHPKPKITSFTRTNGTVTLNWDGPSAQLVDVVAGSRRDAHVYQVERSLDMQTFQPEGPTTSLHTATIPECCGGAVSVFYRVTLLPPSP